MKRLPIFEKRVYHMTKQRLSILAVSAIAVLLAGCVTGLPLRKSDRKLNVSKNSLVLLRFATVNFYDPLFTPKLSYIQFFNLQTNKRFRFQPLPEDQTIDALGYNHLWLGLFLPPGDYLIERLDGKCETAMLGSSFKLKPFTKFTLPPQSISYSGLIEISNAKPVKDGTTVSSSAQSFSSEALLGNALAGYLNNSAFQIKVIDNSQEDLTGFRYFFHGLANREIQINLATN